jgi:hypothetical protein
MYPRGQISSSIEKTTGKASDFRDTNVSASLPSENRVISLSGRATTCSALKYGKCGRIEIVTDALPWSIRNTVCPESSPVRKVPPDKALIWKSD